MHIIRDERLVEFYRKPISKKKRILAKWKKDPRNYRPDLKRCYIGKYGIIAHPSIADIFENMASGYNWTWGCYNKFIWDQMESYYSHQRKERETKEAVIAQASSTIDRNVLDYVYHKFNYNFSCYDSPVYLNSTITA